MKRKAMWTLALLAVTTFGFIACIDKTPSIKEPLDTQELTKNQPEVHGNEIKAEDVQLTNPLLSFDWACAPGILPKVFELPDRFPTSCQHW